MIKYGRTASVKVISRAITGISIADYGWNSEGGILDLSAGKKIVNYSEIKSTHLLNEDRQQIIQFP